MQSAIPVVTLALSCLFAAARTANAQTASTVHPIVVMPVSNCGCSPAELDGSKARQAAYTPRNVGTVVKTVLPNRSATCTSCGFVPLPGPAIPDRDPREPVTVIERPASRVVVGRPLVPTPASVPPALPSQTVRVLRPPVPTPTLPKDYVVGRGLIGQPKLYINGQPVRNFLRYLSL